MSAVIAGLHALFWTIFAVRGVVGLLATRAADSQTTPTSIGVVVLHALGMGAFFGALLPTLQLRIWLWPPQPELGAVVLVAANALAIWTLLVFRSWRLAAQLDSDHELMTTGPFALVRHPIYVSVNLYGLGTLLALPSAWLLAGTVALWVTGDTRARAEELALIGVFGDDYRQYSQRVKRFFPGVY